jgi:uncharacterized membrane protein
MNIYRDEWMEQLLARDMRMVDAQVTAALQNGTATGVVIVMWRRQFMSQSRLAFSKTLPR